MSNPNIASILVNSRPFPTKSEIYTEKLWESDATITGVSTLQKTNLYDPEYCQLIGPPKFVIQIKIIGSGTFLGPFFRGRT